MALAEGAAGASPAQAEGAQQTTPAAAPPIPDAGPKAGHWWLASALASGLLGVILGVACVVVAPATPDVSVELGATPARLGIVALSTLLTLAWGAWGGLLSLPLRRYRRVALGVQAFVLWLWFVPFLVEIGYRRVTGMQPTESALAPIFAAPGQYYAELSGGARAAILAALAAMGGVAALIAGLVPRIARRVTSIRSPIALGVVIVLELVAVVSTDFLSPGWSWVQSSVPLVSLVLGVRVPGRPDLQELARPTPIDPGPVMGTPSTPPPAVVEHPPNVLLITLESVNAAYVGYGGAPRPVTPNIDRLAAAAHRMRRAWALAPATCPAVGGLLTSTLPRRSWTYDTYTDTDYPRESIYSTLRAVGYDTASISSDDQISWGLGNFLAPVQASFMVGPDDLAGEHWEYAGDRSGDDHEMVTRAMDWMTGRTKPWMLYVNFHRTHFPYWLPKGHPYPFLPTAVTKGFSLIQYPPEDRVPARNRFDATLQYVDSEVGRLLEGLESRGGGIDNTLIVLVSDHGEAFGERSIVVHAKSVFESEMRVPLFVRWPGHVAPGDDLSPVSLVDVTPTILALTGVPLPPVMQGSDMLAKSAGQRAVISEVQILGMQDGIVCWPWKLVLDRPSHTALLFDLEHDAWEHENLAMAHPEIAATLVGLLNGMDVAQVNYYQSDEKRTRNPPRIPMCPAL